MNQSYQQEWLFLCGKTISFWIWTENDSFKYNYTKTRQDNISQIAIFIGKHILYYEIKLFLSRDLKLYIITGWHPINILVNSSFYMLDLTRVARAVGSNMMDKIKYWAKIRFH